MRELIEKVIEAIEAPRGGSEQLEKIAELREMVGGDESEENGSEEETDNAE